ncbi:MAG: type II toxin-antitoxin system HicA family toxin [Candidatus Omnitrophica bacterium]|nr:type II toxin-antitoxin system HicA family toxin [Candidatus Omnitrophota bacterium]
MPQATGSRTIQALQKTGFILRRQKGSHAVLVHSQDLSRRAIVPVHGSKTVKPGTLRSILKGAGISIEEFKELLK